MNDLYIAFRYEVKIMFREVVIKLTTEASFQKELAIFLGCMVLA